ncbi:MAG TPA: DUF6644 family protein [Candidatus Acidoferrales bacterium]|jgi:hypothetical protein|nr:DUF6644 family protein [Candidatus Acidoferrales bacterium]
MWFANFLQWLHDTQLSTTMRESIWAEPLVETIHVLTLTLFLGFAVLLDLRLLGVCMRRRKVSEVLDQLNPFLFVGFAIMVVSGLLLFTGDPPAFWGTTFFKLKMVFLVFAGLNVLIFNATIGKKVAEWDMAAKTPSAAKVAAIVSIVLWVAIVAAGRAIAYSLPPP